MAKLTAYSSATSLNEGMFFYTAIDTDSDGTYESRKVSLATVRARLLKSAVADGATAVAHSLDTLSALSTAGAKILSLKNNGVEKFSVDKDGDAQSASGVFGSSVVDGASAEAFAFSTVALSTAGAKAFVLKNNATEIFSIDKDGNILAGQGSFGALYFSSAAATTLAAATPAKAAGTTAAQGATAENVTVATTNRLTYTGTVTRAFQITATFSVTKASGAASVGSFYLYKDGAAIPGLQVNADLPNTGASTALSIAGTVSLAENEYVELYLATDTGDDLTVTVGSLAITAL